MVHYTQIKEAGLFLLIKLPSRVFTIQTHLHVSFFSPLYFHPLVLSLHFFFSLVKFTFNIFFSPAQIYCFFFFKKLSFNFFFFTFKFPFPLNNFPLFFFQFPLFAAIFSYRKSRRIRIFIFFSVQNVNRCFFLLTLLN